MAVTAISLVALGQNVMSDALTMTAATTAADGFTIDYTKDDDKILLVVRNDHASAAKTITIKKGNGLQGVADTAAYSLDAGEIKVINLESGKFKNVSGTNKGKVLAIPESTDIKIAAVLLP